MRSITGYIQYDFFHIIPYIKQPNSFQVRFLKLISDLLLENKSIS